MKKYSRGTWMFLVPAMMMIAVAVIGALKGDMKPVNIVFGLAGMTFLMLAIMTEAKARKDSGSPD